MKKFFLTAITGITLMTSAAHADTCKGERITAQFATETLVLMRFKEIPAEKDLKISNIIYCKKSTDKIYLLLKNSTEELFWEEVVLGLTMHYHKSISKEGNVTITVTFPNAK